jgi:threonine dehydrogenase-like Zn-dependent dehydrogenase
MKALVYHGPGQKSWETVADPKQLDPTDIVVQIDTATICGTDLHMCPVRLRRPGAAAGPGPAGWRIRPRRGP